MRLVGKWPQMTRQLELPLSQRGEAPAGKRSEEAPTAMHESERSGARTSTSRVSPDWPRHLNFSNRPVRTRMPGGVAGVPAIVRGPYADQGVRRTREHFVWRRVFRNGTVGRTFWSTSMSKVPSIVPISDLRDDAANILGRMRKSHEPVVITQRGRAAAVMVSVEEYERSTHEREILRLLAQGDREVAAGKGYELEDVFKEADRILAR
jgi:prevent-host-death family protein